MSIIKIGLSSPMRVVTICVALVALLSACQTPPPPAKPSRTAAELELLKRVRFVNSPEGARAILDNAILFASDSAVLAAQSEGVLDVLRPSFSKARGQIIVEGHTDSKGSLDYNTKLSVRRAEAVKVAIVARQVPPERIITKGLAFSKPVVAGAKTEQDHSLNRRAEIVFVNETVESIFGSEFETKNPPPTESEAKAESALDKASGFFKGLLEQGNAKP